MQQKGKKRFWHQPGETKLHNVTEGSVNWAVKKIKRDGGGTIQRMTLKPGKTQHQAQKQSRRN